MAIRRPAFKYQIGDPTTRLDPYICTLESGAMALDVLTGGRINVWGGNLAAYCGRSAAVIIDKGTNLYNVETAWRHWGKDLDIRSGYSWTAALSDLRAGYWIILQGDYDQFSLATRCQDSFRGDHAVLLGPEFNSSGAILMADPLCKTFKYVPRAEAANYANKLGRNIYYKLGRRWTGQIFYARVKPAAISGTLSPRWHASVIHPTSLWNEGTKKWVYGDPVGPADNRIKVGTTLITRSATYYKGANKIPCYPIDKSSPHYPNYYVPKANVKLISKV